jgi:DNA-directed RNA polymerase specialized sigma24 family protein
MLPTTGTDPRPVPDATLPLKDGVAASLRRLQEGDTEAMADLARQVTPWLHHVLWTFRLGREAADDVVQSTLLVALLHARELRDPAAGLSWLSVVARREALRVVRVEQRYVPVDELPAVYTTATTEGPEEIVLAGLSRAVVRRTVAKLPPRHRVLIERVVRSEKPTYAAISAELRMPLGSIGPSRRRGLDLMRRLLAEDPEWDCEASA